MKLPGSIWPKSDKPIITKDLVHYLHKVLFFVWKHYFECGATIRSITQRKIAAMDGCQLLGHRQTQTKVVGVGTALAASVEPVKDLLLLRIRDTRSMIDDR